MWIMKLNMWSMFLVGICALSSLASARSGMLVTAPSKLQLGTVEKLCVTLHQLNHVHLSVSLRDDDVSHHLTNATVSDAGCHDIYLDHSDIEAGEYELHVEGSSDGNYIFSEHATVKVEQGGDIVFIQTDKAVYNPGQAVKFRVLVVDAELKPRMNQIAEVYIQDPSGTRMMQWLNVSVTKYQGIADLEMPMSNEPTQGTWKISVVPSEGGTKEMAEFKVEEYVLPKYEITIKPPSYVPVTADMVEGEVCAMYTYGEPVKGQASVKICRRNHYWDNSPPLCLDRDMEIRGCETFRFHAQSLELNFQDRWSWSENFLLIDASVLEDGTGITLNATQQEVKVTQDLFTIDFKPHSPDYFKPGLPYHGKVLVKRPDGTPAPGEKVEVSVRAHSQNQNFRKTMTSNDRGEVVFSLPPLSKDTATVSIQGSMPDYTTDSDNLVPAWYHRHAYRHVTIVKGNSPSAYHSVKQWYSPTDSYIQIDPIEDTARCGEDLTLNVSYTREEGPHMMVYYQVISHGNQVLSGSQHHNLETAKSRVYNPDGSFTEKELHECPPGQKWSRCGPDCVPSCHDLSPMCGESCRGRCVCERPGTVMYQGECIMANDCPVMRDSCTGGRVWRDCGSACTPKCSDSGPQMCTANCVARCQCPDPSQVWHYGECIERSECPEDMAGPPAPPQQQAGSTREVVSMSLTIPVNAQMSGSARVLVYYVRADAETVADSVKVNVEACTRNKVSMVFRDETKYPGDEAMIDISADPGSVCSLGVVDKSVHLLGGKNSLTVAQVVAELSEFDLTESDLAGKDDYCERKMNPPMPDPICLQPKRTGACRGYFRKWYYNSATAACETFVYGGCRGNDNRFDSEAECRKKCEVDEVAQNDDRWIRKQHRRRHRSRKGRSVIPDWPGRYYSDYLDSIHAFKHGGLVSVTDLDLESRPCEKQRYRIAYSVFEDNAEEMPMFGLESEALPEMAVDEDAGVDGGSPPETKKVDVRTYFPETWLWDLHLVGDSGSLSLREELPHTITEWVGTGFCTNQATGLGVSAATAIKGFQPFFASMTLPYSVIRGEKLKLPITVFNYLSECLVVRLTLAETTSYEVMGATEYDSCICGQESVTQYFKITAKTLGEIDIKVQAESVDNNGVCGNDVFMSTQIGVSDAVVRKLLVEAEGREEEYTHSAFMCPQEGERLTETVKLDLPTEYVEGTPRATVSAIGDIMGPTLSGLDSLVRMPTGCGEQNMLLFAPNIYVMQYLSGTDQLTPEMKDKALGYMRTGYQRELTYRHTDGSFSAFGKNDDSGSTWLTAFVVKSFAQAKQFIFIDNEDLEKSVLWFITKQKENGCFEQVGRVIHKDMKGGLEGGSNDASLTSFVLIALLEAKPFVDVQNLDSVIASAFACLRTQSSEDTYTMMLNAYARALQGEDGRESLQRLMEELDSRKVEQDGMVHWTRDTPNANAEDIDGWEVSPIHKPKPQSAEVELTAYMLLTYVKSSGMEAVGQAMPLVRWLTGQRNAYGGFSSTQDTVLALQSLAHYARMAYTDGSDLSVTLQTTDPDLATTQWAISDDNRLLLHRREVTLPGSVEVTVRGQGCVLVQAAVKYNVADITTPAEAFSLRPEVTRAENCKYRGLTVCARYLGSDGASNMAVITVKMVSGWIPVKDTIKQLLKVDHLNLKRYEIDANFVNFYFDELTSDDDTCLMFAVEQDVEVDEAKPGFVKVYDYYKTELSVTRAYEITPTCGTKEELPDLTEEEFRRKMEDFENNPGWIEQVRVPHGGMDPDELRRERDRQGTKEDLPELTEEEFRRKMEEFDKNPDLIEQVRVPLGGREDHHSREEERVPVDEPEIIPEYVRPLESQEAECQVCEPEELSGSLSQQFKDNLCSSAFAYRALVRGNHLPYQAKVLQDVRPVEKTLIVRLLKLNVHSECGCDLSDIDRKRRVLILSDVAMQPEDEEKSSLTLTSQSKLYIFPEAREEQGNLLREMLRYVRRNQDVCAPINP